MCGGGDRRARKRAEKEARRARKEAERRERAAIRRAEEQARRMEEQQRKSYEAMQAMIPKPPEVPKARPASTKVETSTTPEPKGPSGYTPDDQKVRFGEDMAGGVKLRKPKKRQRRGRSSLLIGLAPGVRGSGRGPNIN